MRERVVVVDREVRFTNFRIVDFSPPLFIVIYLYYYHDGARRWNGSSSREREIEIDIRHSILLCRSIIVAWGCVCGDGAGRS